MTIAIYVRQSVDKKDSISIESQIEICKKEIVNNEHYIVYSDKGYSGKDTNRPAFEKMMDDIKRGLINKVIVYKLDRISRSTLDFANIIDIFKEHNVDFISSTEKFDTSTPIGKAMLHIIMVFAELERETIQQRIIDNYYSRGKKGMYLGGPTPYGFTRESTYINDKKTTMLVENKEQSTHVKKIYDLYANTDMSLGQISDYLNEKGVPSAQGKNWDSGKISRIMRSPVYVKADVDVYMYYKNRGSIVPNDTSNFIGVNGCYLFGKRDRNARKYTNVSNHVLAVAPHKGLVDSRTWLKCQYKLDNNQQIKNSGKGKYTWLTGLAKCGYCGYAVSATVSNNKYLYFTCRGKYNLKVCDGFKFAPHVKEVERKIEQLLFKKIEEVKKVDLVITEKNNSVNQLQVELLEIDKKIENLLNQLAEANDISMKYINQKLSELDGAKNILLEQLRKETIANSKNVSMQKVFEKISDWSKLSLEDKKVVARTFIDKVFVKEDEITINWKV